MCELLYDFEVVMWIVCIVCEVYDVLDFKYIDIKNRDIFNFEY